ncbi:MAG: acetyl-CoA carboxylase carboxyl transferase subunit alpha [Campylobacterales bacterium]
MAVYLDFEKKIEQLVGEIEMARLKKDEAAVAILEEQLRNEQIRVYANLSEYQRLLLARHPDRPYAMDYIPLLMNDAYELHGDRHFRDDESIVCFIGYIGDLKCVVIGEEKGRGTKNKLKRNFGMPHPEGYRKALRVAKMAEKFGLPLLMLVDTPGAYPGIGAEERGQSEAIARNLLELSDLDTITVSVVIGEGGSGGALAIGVADRLAMLSNSVFSVISPEGCAAILWNDPSKAETATKAMKVTAQDLKTLGLIDDIIDEPLIGAHRDKEGAARAVKNYFLSTVASLSQMSRQQRLAARYDKLMSLGRYGE